MKQRSEYKPKAPIKGFEHIGRYWDNRINVPAAKILPGECYVSASGEMIVTVLGSCVSACIRDKVLGVGGMNHFMLPVKKSDKMITRHSIVNAELCYGNWAMEYLINAILKCGGRRDRLEVKVFGGGRVLTSLSNIDIGRRNVEFVMEYLQRDGLSVCAQDIGSDYPRKILYFPDTGAVKLKKLRTRINDTIEKREKAYLDTLITSPKAGDVELF